LYADVRKWVRRGWIDYVAPQVYWNIGFAAADYAKLVPWWSAQVAGTHVHLVIGQAAYRVGAPAAWSDPRELARHMAFNRRYPRVRGDIWFSAKDVLANRLGSLGIVARENYRRPALVPAMPRVAAPRPRPPDAVSASPAAGGIRVTWNADASTAYGVYRLTGARCERRDARRLLAVLPRGAGALRDATARAGRSYRYAVTAIDRFRRESSPALSSRATAGGT
jgi:hypothetical protein